jgi:ribosomal protein S18 acetylase RimI-like enzyme
MNAEHGNIFPVTPNDFSVIQQLIEKEFPYIQKPRQQLEAKINNPFFFLFKIVHGKKFAGFCEIEVLMEKQVCRLNALAVLSEYRKKGLGNRLLKEVLGFLKKEGFETVWLLVKSENRIARKMYEKNGFKWNQTLPKKIDNSVVEEYKLELRPETDAGVQ